MSVWLHLPYVCLWTIFIRLMYGCGLFLFAICMVVNCFSMKLLPFFYEIDAQNFIFQ
jgi:hypothetical protein